MVRRRRKKAKGLNNAAVICITTMVVLNIAGISYGMWNDDVNIIASVSTGKMEACFCDEYLVDVKNGDGQLTVNFEDDDTMIIEGSVHPGYKAFIHYCVKNEGTVPIKYDNHNNNEHEGLQLILNQSSGVIKPYDYLWNENGNPKLHINADSVGEYSFDIPLVFKIPHTNNSWQKTLIIKVDIDVVAPVTETAVVEGTSTQEGITGEENPIEQLEFIPESDMDILKSDVISPSIEENDGKIIPIEKPIIKQEGDEDLLDTDIPSSTTEQVNENSTGVEAQGEIVNEDEELLGAESTYSSEDEIIDQTITEESYVEIAETKDNDAEISD